MKVYVSVSILCFNLFLKVFGHVNDSNFISYPISEMIAIDRAMPLYQFDEVFHHYRSDFRKREPQFIGFDIQDDNLEVSKDILISSFNLYRHATS